MPFSDEEEGAFADRAKDPIDLGTFSPRPQRPITMDFPDAMREIILGKSITKLEWTEKGEDDCYVLLRESRLQIFRNGKFHDWVISDGDLSGEDYVTLNHSNR